MRAEREKPLANGYSQGTRFPGSGQQLAANPEFDLRRIYQLRLHVAKVARVGDEPGEPAARMNAVALARALIVEVKPIRLFRRAGLLDQRSCLGPAEA